VLCKLFMKISDQAFPIRPILSLPGCLESGGKRSKGSPRQDLPGAPLVSVVTIVFNGEKYLERAMESLFSQTYGNIEYVVVDGGSSDSTVAILRKRQADIDYWCSAKDNGISDAFNRGISLSTGTYVGILNADDWYDRDTVANAVKAFAESPEAGVVHGDMRQYKGGKHIFTIKPDLGAGKIRYEMPYNHPTCFVKREVYLRHGGFSQRLRIAMDYELLLRYSLLGINFSYVPGIVSNMPLGGQSDEKALFGLKEMLRVSVEYGYPKLPAYFWFLNKAARYWLRKIVGTDSGLARLYRRFSSRKSVGADHASM